MIKASIVAALISACFAVPSLALAQGGGGGAGGSGGSAGGSAGSSTAGSARAPGSAGAPHGGSTRNYATVIGHRRGARRCLTQRAGGGERRPYCTVDRSRIDVSVRPATCCTDAWWNCRDCGQWSVRRCVFVRRQKNGPTTQAETVCYSGCAASREAIRHGISSTILLIG
jgi:hypothetical protein